MASPVTPSSVKALIPDPTSSKCSGFTKALLQIPLKFYQFLNWLLDADGNITQEFRRQVTNTGQVIMMATPSAENASRLLCNGQEVSRTDYPDLFAAIGVLYGTPSSGTVFKLPDLRAKFPVCVGAFESAATVTLGGTGGEEKHVLTVAELAAHAHRMWTGESDGAFNGVRDAMQTVDDVGIPPEYLDGTDPDHPFVEDTGSDEAHNNLPPYFGLYFYILT